MSAARKPAPANDSTAALTLLLEELFPGDDLPLPAHIGELIRLHAPLADQRPATCGAYVLTYVLPAHGFTHVDGESLGAEDFMAHLAQVTIDAREDPSTYRFAMHASADRSRVGTSPDGVARAVEVATSGRLAAIPVPGRGTLGQPQLDSERWNALLDLIEGRFLDGGADVIFNYEANQLLDARDDAYCVENLRRPEAKNRIPLDRWGVGHFAPMAALWKRPTGERWMALLNSFKDRGFAGVEPQPAELMRRAVVREDGRGGGVLLIVPGAEAAQLERKIESINLELAMWDNGSLPPADWRWTRMPA
jgi:Family of unknown function (DUF6885)